ncbi:putative permease transmembrane component [Salmonella enterica subsp. enterica serovar Daytona]|uniref:Putative permease transmembrane component n=1 Tax=Salmonella enterica subsp. enterica serovar Daytona TaxID=1962639 RepID=A0A447JFU1_SALET|nr:putative permease transmembrane component [Salmonella enterica subsp. enterica serovar Daytona]
MKRLCDPLLWLIVLFLLLLFGLPYSQPFFAALFPDLPRPVYQQESFAALALAHFWLVGISSLFAVVVGRRRRDCGHARKWERVSSPGGDYRCRRADLSPRWRYWRSRYPSWVLVSNPAIIALILYGVLPHPAGDPGRAGRGACQRDERCQRYGNEPSPNSCIQVELPLAAPVILAGIRTSGDYQYWYGDHRFNGGGQYVRHADHYRA